MAVSSPGVVRSKPLRLLVGWLLLALILAACQSGPTGLADGEYEYVNSSALLGEPGPAAAAILSGGRLTITVDGTSSTYILGGDGDSYTLCPPTGRGQPTLLDGPVATLAEVRLEHPAAFGDCHDPGPKWLTIVDIDSFDEGEYFPFTRWVTFCVPECGLDSPGHIGAHIPPDS